MSKADDAILFYEGEYYMFSNFSAFAVEWRGKVWMTSEHAYQAAKFDDKDIINQIFLARSAYDSKKIARENNGNVRKNWDEVKLSVMEEILRTKLEQHPYIKEKLIKSGGRYIIEDSHKDAFWGRGLDYKGQNQLGELWMKIRSELN